MIRYALRRLAEAVPTTFGILLLTFVLFNVVTGGSPALTVLGKGASAETVERFNRLHGYDKPLVFGRPGGERRPDGSWASRGVFDSQFFCFLRSVATGDLGYSAKLREPVADVLKRGVGPSLSLTVPVLLAGMALAIVFALVAAAFRGRWPDRTILFFSAVFMSVNYVVWVLLGQFLLAFKARWFPIWGYESAYSIVLPAAIGVVSSLGVDVRYFRTAILDEIHRPYVLAARARGVSRARTLVRHVLRNALVPIVAYVALAIPYLFTGSLLLESFFGIPGLGSVAINAIQSADLAVVRAMVVVGALVYQAANLAADLLFAALDPRIRLDK